MVNRLGHVDLATGKIHGCKKGSWKWHHEKAHILFNKNSFFSFLLLSRNYLSDMWMASITLWIFIQGKIFSTAAVILYILYMGIDIFEEMWCNSYANEIMIRKQ